MTSLNDLLQAAVDDGTAPGIVVIAKDKDGKVDYAKAFSRADGTPYSLDTVMELTSMSKFPTAIAALQLVEKGLIGLDDDVSDLIPSLGKQGILVSVADDGTPTVRERKNPITLRRLITHSAGTGYHFMHEGLGKVKAAQKGGPPGNSVDESFDYPLLFEPGEGWAYGAGLDRVGQVVEKLSGLPLDEYMKKNMWEPLGVSSSTFFPAKIPDVDARRVPMAFRDDPEGPAVEKPEVPTMTTGLKVAYGGHGMFASMSDYAKMVYSLLIDDEKLLKKETAALMFEPQLTPASKEQLHKFMETPVMKSFFPSPPTPDDRDYGLSGLLIVGENHRYWRKGALMWGGAGSLNWFIDRSAGVCGVFGAQVLPSDQRMRDLIDAFQTDVYRQAGKLN
ncbi:beta-lactamase family protein [Hypomontagnella submonticulosa]|nr:beta-lactamase family protein [Hypomontagnella submonticulosa]